MTAPKAKFFNVWLYRNVQTSQVLVSSTRILVNKTSMAQLPPNRRLHPTALRKDHWSPLAKASFSDEQIMRQVYHRMLEYRRWRAQEPVPVERRSMTTKARRRLEMDQVATSIADLAASLQTFAATQLGQVTISWLNEEEKVYAKEWPANVRHVPALKILNGRTVYEDWDLLKQPDALQGTNTAQAQMETTMTTS